MVTNPPIASNKMHSTKPLASTAPAWLQDVTRVAQYLARLSLETAALAALIIQEGKLWAYAGQLSQPAAQELAQTVIHYWERGNGSDLARFVHLNATDNDYMLYATAISADMALAMVFNIEIPFSKIRSQASRLARSLASPPRNDLADEAEKPASPAERSDLSPVIPEVGVDGREEDEPLDLASLTPLFEDAPPAKPANSPAFLPPEGQTHGDVPARQAHVSTPVQDGLEPAYPAVCQLTYACILIPRMPSHTVEGDLARRVTEWMPQLCLAYGWRLERMAIRSDSVSWVINVPPTVSPSYMMRILRQQISARIFAHFPLLGQENPSGDYWAPGYLIMSSGQLFEEAMVNNFIQQTRQRQGVSRPMDIKKVHG